MLLFRCACDEILSVAEDRGSTLGECPACGRVLRSPQSSINVRGKLRFTRAQAPQTAEPARAMAVALDQEETVAAGVAQVVSAEAIAAEEALAVEEASPVEVAPEALPEAEEVAPVGREIEVDSGAVDSFRAEELAEEETREPAPSGFAQEPAVPEVVAEVGKSDAVAGTAIESASAEAVNVAAEEEVPAQEEAPAEIQEAASPGSAPRSRISLRDRTAGARRTTNADGRAAPRNGLQKVEAEPEDAAGEKRKLRVWIAVGVLALVLALLAVDLFALGDHLGIGKALGVAPAASSPDEEKTSAQEKKSETAAPAKTE